MLIPPGPRVRSGLLISKETLGASDKFPAVATPLSMNESSPFPGFCNRRISLVLSLTLNTAPSLGVTTSASALKTCKTWREMARSVLGRLSSLWLKKWRIGRASRGKSSINCPFWPFISSIVPLILKSPLVLQFQPSLSIPADDMSHCNLLPA